MNNEKIKRLEPQATIAFQSKNIDCDNLEALLHIRVDADVPLESTVEDIKEFLQQYRIEFMRGNTAEAKATYTPFESWKKKKNKKELRIAIQQMHPDNNEAYRARVNCIYGIQAIHPTEQQPSYRLRSVGVLGSIEFVKEKEKGSEVSITVFVND